MYSLEGTGGRCCTLPMNLERLTGRTERLSHGISETPSHIATSAARRDGKGFQHWLWRQSDGGKNLQTVRCCHVSGSLFMWLRDHTYARTQNKEERRKRCQTENTSNLFAPEMCGEQSGVRQAPSIQLGPNLTLYDSATTVVSSTTRHLTRLQVCLIMMLLFS